MSVWKCPDTDISLPMSWPKTLGIFHFIDKCLNVFSWYKGWKFILTTKFWCLLKGREAKPSDQSDSRGKILHILRMYWGHYPQCNLTVVLTVSCLQYRIKSVSVQESCDGESHWTGQVCASLISIIITRLIISRDGKLDTRWVSHRHWWWHSLLDL